MKQIFGSALLLVALTAAQNFAGDFPNVAQVPGTLLNGPIAPQQGRTAIVCWHGGRIISVPEPPGSQDGADLRVRIVNISDPANPQITTQTYQAGGFNSHAYFHYGPYLFIGPHETAPGNNTYRDSLFYTGTSGVFQERNMEDNAGLPIGTYTRSGTQSPWGARMYWSYGDVGGDAYLAIRRSIQEFTHDWNNGGAPTGPAVKATWDHLGRTGVIGMPFIMGNILVYASDQSGTGVATYDISDPANPVLLDVLKEGNPGGYFPEVYGHYVFFPRRDGEGGVNSQAGFMVVDFQDPTNLRVVANRNLTGSNQYVTFQDEYAFMNNYKIDMRTFDTVLTLPTNGVTLDASQFALPVGNLVVTGGYGSLGPGLAIWAHQAAPDTRGPFVAYHVPAADQTNYSRVCPITLSIPETLRTETIVNGTTLIVRPVGGAAIPCWHSFGHNKLLTVTPIQPLAANTTYEVLLTSGIQDAAGNGMEPYTFRFSTGALTGGNRPPAATALTANPAPAAPGVSVNFAATASDPDGNPIEFRFDFGDGTPKTAWSASNAASHAYVDARHYQVTVQVRDNAGALSSFSRGITVATAPTGPFPTRSSPIALGTAARRVWNVNPDTNTITAVNADTQAKIWEMPTGADPRSVALASDGSLWVACHDADRVDVLDGSSGTLITSIATGYGSAPTGICASPDGNTMYASCKGDGTLRRFAVAGRSQSGSLALGPTPQAIAITGNGTRALVTRFISGEHEGSVYDVNLAGSMTLTRTIRLARHHVQDGSASSRGVPNYLAGVTITPDNTRAWIVGKKDNTERGTFTTANMALGQDSTVRAQLVVVDLSTNAEATSLRMDIDNSEAPTSVAFSPLGDYGFIALQGNNQIFVVDYLEFMRPNSAKGLLTRLGTGLAPQGLAIDASIGRMFTQNFMGRSMTALELTQFFASGNLNVPSATIQTVATETLTAAVLRGKQIFYNSGDTRMSAEGYISCASCHVDGGHDGRIWDFTQRGEGFRNSTDLRGRSGVGHGAVHWTANFDEIQDFENDIRGAFGGSGFMTNADFAATTNPLGAQKAGRSAPLDDLSAYVTSLNGQSIPRSPFRSPDGTMTATGSAGQVIFNRENCATCHTPGQGFTDRTRHNVGTLRASSGQRIGGTLDGIDTPTLLGVHAGAPYFHNGSAKTLAEVFTIAGGDLRQAESGVLANGAGAGDVSYEPMKDWHGGAFVSLDNNGEDVTFNNIDGGPGGVGMIEIRHATHYANGNLVVIVNGVTLPLVTLTMAPNDPNYIPNEWRTHRIPNVTFAAGTANTVTLRRGTNGGLIDIDDVLFSTPAINSLAAAHRRTLTPQEQSDLIDYIRQLDGNDVPPPPAIGSVVATPNPAAPGAVILFSVAANGAAPLTYNWNFGDGSIGVGTSPSHAYTAEGVYSVTVTVTDITGQLSAASVDVTVVVGGGSGGTGPIDSDGDGISDENEIADGTDPLDPNSFLKKPLSIGKAGGKMSFKTDDKDSVSLQGSLDLPADFDAEGKVVMVDVGGATATFTLDKKGKSKVGLSSFALTIKMVKDKTTKLKRFTGGPVKFRAKLAGGTWADDWADEGVDEVNATKNAPMNMTAQIRLNGNIYETVLSMLYTSKPGSGASIKKAK